jgi:hypothetical protein
VVLAGLRVTTKTTGKKRDQPLKTKTIKQEEFRTTSRRNL